MIVAPGLEQLSIGLLGGGPYGLRLTGGGDHEPLVVAKVFNCIIFLPKSMQVNHSVIQCSAHKPMTGIEFCEPELVSLASCQKFSNRPIRT